jgi:tRNA(Ile2)-agmatinylcytidine synthase
LNLLGVEVFPTVFLPRLGMNLWIGVDDTDSLTGMCTTFLATELVRSLARDHDLIGYPRLVRLNPNIPWKTRGNGAVCIRVGRGRGEPRLVGQIAGREVLAFPRGVGPADPEDIADDVASIVERWSCFDDPKTQPGFVVLRSPAPEAFYWKGVRGILERNRVLRGVKGLGVVRGYNGGRGIIGATAATSWRPRRKTYEVLAYRSRKRWGTSRRIDPGSVVEMDRAFPSTFNNYDYENQRVVLAPRTPCPVLFGIRGSESADLRSAMMRIRGERANRWLLFETNQGTDDHVVRSCIPRSYRTIRFLGTVGRAPRTLPGGHVVFSLNGIDATAYEPSKQFRRVVRALVPGDRLEVVGAVRDVPRTLNLEKLHVESLAEVLHKIENPVCPGCGRHAKSTGIGAGYRCRRCHLRFGAREARTVVVPREIGLGWYEPPAGSRRHLSMPLKHMTGLPGFEFGPYAFGSRGQGRAAGFGRPNSGALSAGAT